MGEVDFRELTQTTRPLQSLILLQVLGCAIVSNFLHSFTKHFLTRQFFILITGFAVKFYRARRLRKLENRAATDLAERGEITEKASEEVPFGIRAIEAGDEVDGIWNSRAATPLQALSAKSVSEPSTPTMKPQKLQKAWKFGSESSLPGLELPEPAHMKYFRPAGE